MGVTHQVLWRVVWLGASERDSWGPSPSLVGKRGGAPSSKDHQRLAERVGRATAFLGVEPPHFMHACVRGAQRRLGCRQRYGWVVDAVLPHNRSWGSTWARVSTPSCTDLRPALLG